MRKYNTIKQTFYDVISHFKQYSERRQEKTKAGKTKITFYDPPEDSYNGPKVG